MVDELKMPPETGNHWPVLSGAVIIVVGTAFAGIAVHHLLREELVLPTIVLGGGLPLVLAFVSIVGGGLIARRGFSKRQALTIMGWWFFGTLVAGLMGITAIMYQQSHGVDVVDARYIVTNHMTGGSVGGLLVGYFYAESRRREDQLAIEQRKLANERERLEVLNRVIRHDIRNDMNVILGWLRALNDHVDEEGHEMLDRAHTSGEHVIELTRIAREYVAVVLGEIEPDLSEVPLREALGNEIRTREKSYPEASFVVPDELPAVTVRANEMLSSVFRNVLNNAIQHNDKDSPEVVVSVEQCPESVVVSIADNGPGIPDDQKEAVFGKGERGLESPSTGMGLYLVRTLIEEYGGDVWIEDNDPRGAVFKLKFPRQ